MAKILVTGANGFLGSWVVRRLLKDNHQVVTLLRKNSDTSELQGLTTEIKYGDITDEESTIAATTGCDFVFHLAGLVSYKRRDLDLMFKVNVVGTQNILKACQLHRVKRLVHFSSVVAVGAGFSQREVLNENSEYNVQDLGMGYFDTKREAELWVQDYVRKGFGDAVIVNPSTVYGAGDARKGSRKMQIKVAQGQLKFYPPGGVNVLGVEDLVEGAWLAWQKGRSGERYILCGENLRIKEVFRQIALAAGVQPPFIPLPARILHWAGQIGDAFDLGFSRDNAYTATMFHYFSNQKARRELGFNPGPASVAIQKSVQWMKENHLLDS
jgi:dihydroflavonol-4-reductase